MTHLPVGDPLSQVLLTHLGADLGQSLSKERLRASRPVFRFSVPGDGLGLVGKFFHEQVPTSPQDRSLAQEYQHYLGETARELTAAGFIPRLVGQSPHVRLGLLLEAIPGPDLDHYLSEAAQGRELEACLGQLARLAELLVFFHTRPLPHLPLSPEPVLAYFQKLRGQLQALGLLSPEEVTLLAEESQAWEARWGEHLDRQVLVHGDATPTNFLFPPQRVVAIDLERLRPGDRLFDLSWVAGEIRHAWGWRGRAFEESETAIRHFFRSYISALPADAALTRRIFALNPWYMALAELRIARNAYLSWEYRRALVAEAQRCLAYGRRLP
ncbi:MAG: aminoglycoside phosphotransferase family protein [Desulfobaccales bacterium]